MLDLTHCMVGGSTVQRLGETGLKMHESAMRTQVRVSARDEDDAEPAQLRKAVAQPLQRRIACRGHRQHKVPHGRQAASRSGQHIVPTQQEMRGSGIDDMTVAVDRREAQAGL